MVPSKRLFMFLCISIIALASCGGGGDDESAVSSTSAASDAAAATTTSTTVAEPTTETTAATTTSAAPASDSGKIELVFDDGRSWTFDGTCTYTPDKTGPAASLWNVGAEELADGTGFNAIMAFPFDAEKTDPVLIGTMVDADENLYVLIEAEDVSVGSELILNLGIHDGLFKALDDPADITAVLTCQL